MDYLMPFEAKKKMSRLNPVPEAGTSNTEMSQATTMKKLTRQNGKRPVQGQDDRS